MPTNKAIMQATGRSGSLPSCDISWESDFKSLTLSLKNCDVIDSGFESPTSPCLDVSPIGFEYSTFLANNKTEEVEDHLEFEFNEEDLYPQPEQSDDADDETSSYEYEEKVVSCFTDFSSHPRAIPIPGGGKHKRNRIISSTPNSKASFSVFSNVPNFEENLKTEHIYKMMKKLSAEVRLNAENRTITTSLLQDPFWRNEEFPVSPISKI